MICGLESRRSLTLSLQFTRLRYSRNLPLRSKFFDVPRPSVQKFWGLRLLMDRCHQTSIRLNKHEQALRVQEVDFMGHSLTAQGLKLDPKKVETILKLPTPKSKEDIERFNDTVNYLAKFLPRLSYIMEPLRRLTQTDAEWHWKDGEEKAFSEKEKTLSPKLQSLLTIAQTKTLSYSAMPVTVALKLFSYEKVDLLLTLAGR